MFIAFGALFAGVGVRYTLGTLSRPGAGFFPAAVSVILILLGIVILLSSLSVKAAIEKVDKFDWLVLVEIIGSVILFGYLLELLGFVFSLLILILVSSFASSEFSWRATLINAFVMIVMCLIIFVWGLKLTFPVWPVFIGD